MHAKFLEDIWSDKSVPCKNLIQIVQFVWQQYAIVVRCRPEKKTYAKFQIDISKTEGLVRIYTDRQTDRRTWLNGLSSSCCQFIYIYIFLVFSTFPSLCYKLRGKLNISCSDYKTKTHEYV